MKKTSLHHLHVEYEAKMGEFAGYDMPLFYKLGVLKEHLWTRSHCGIFDVSHMGQVVVEGDGAAEYFEKITPSAFQKKKHGRAQYTVMTNETGGIIDDLIITRLADDKFFVVINAGCKDKDIKWMKSHLPDGLNFYHMQEQSLIAVQGPWAERIIYEIFEFDAHDLPYMHLAETRAPCGTSIYISRLGYTGEDGFEISLPNEIAPRYWADLCDHSEANPIGLAARDSLRLDMGYPLYGHDIDDTTSPVEADLTWIIGKSNTGFIGAERVLEELENGISRKRVGIQLTEKGIAREGAEIIGEDGSVIGTLSSGGFSPSLDTAIGMGYVPGDQAEDGAKIKVRVRGRDIAGEICAMPFLKPKTKSMKKAA